MTEVAFSRDDGVVLLLMRGDDPLHRRDLRKFLDQEAKHFGTELQPAGLTTLMDLVRKEKVQVLFAIVKDEVAGATVQFPTVVPKWDTDTKNFQFYPAIYSEDMAVNKEVSDKFREVHNTGLGTTFMASRIAMSADPREGSFDQRHRIPAAALVGEQSWHEGTSIGTLLAKFRTLLAGSKDDSVMVFRDARDFRSASREIVGSRLSVSQFLMPIENGHFKKVDGMFSVEWFGPKGEQIAGTFTLGVSSFTGQNVVRTYLSSNGTAPGTNTMREALRSILKRGTFIADRLGWVESSESETKALMALRIHALGEPAIRAGLKAIGASDRKLGDFIMHPLFMDYEKIPPSMGLRLAQPMPFLAVPFSSTGNGGGSVPPRYGGPEEPRNAVAVGGHRVVLYPPSA